MVSTGVALACLMDDTITLVSNFFLGTPGDIFTGVRNAEVLISNLSSVVLFMVLGKVVSFK